MARPNHTIAIYGLQIGKKRLESFKSDGKVPSGLKINVVAKGQRAHNLHEKFNIITKAAEIKLLEATIETLNNEEQQAKERCIEENLKTIDTAIGSWRESFQTSASSLPHQCQWPNTRDKLDRDSQDVRV